MAGSKFQRRGIAAPADARADSRLPLIVRTASDIALLKAASKFVPGLPRSGIRVVVDGLPPGEAARLEDRTRRYIRACGCAEGAAAALIVLAACALYRGVDVVARGWRTGDAWFAAAALAAAFIAMAVAKLGAIALARRRFEQSCDTALNRIEPRHPMQEGEKHGLSAMGR